MRLLQFLTVVSLLYEHVLALKNHNCQKENKKYIPFMSVPSSLKVWNYNDFCEYVKIWGYPGQEMVITDNVTGI